MGVIWDIIKDIPTAAVLKEKVLDLEGKFAALETENDILNANLCKAETQIEQLRAENQRLTNEIRELNQNETETLHPTAEAILCIFERHHDAPLTREYVLGQTGIDPIETGYYFDELKTSGYLEATASMRGRPVPYRMRQKARKFLIDRRPKR